ncbi:unnamed protein product [Adineta steineri]|uniref:Polyketide synthase n=1 Tax=Adineta steineri TaxID=433720 RepID=A0A819TN19_9BILA|nr:unnamed protein product [Adineta steineri]
MSDIHSLNDLWYSLKESRDVGSATPIHRFDLESFTAHMHNMNNNGQLLQKRLRAAGSVDPCHRLLMLKFVHSFDDAEYSVGKMNGTKTSVRIEQFSTDHAIATTRMKPEHRSRFHELNTLLYNASPRLPYHFNLQGSNVSLDVTCLSADANGYAKGDGLGLLLLLKRLSDAEYDGDCIYCVSRDVLSGHDGNEDKINFVVSSPVGQGRLLENIYSRNNFDTRKILFVEAHDTRTSVGDLIETNCLGRFFNRSNLDPPLLLGSIKSNLGHTEGAAGVASLIKVAMCVYHRGITEIIQFTSFNPKIDAQKYNLHILQNFTPYPSLPNNEKVAIGVNSFGMGDTTTHAIIEEYQPNKKTSVENGHINGYHIKTILIFLSHQQLQERINVFLTEQVSPGLSIISRPTISLAQKICFVFSEQGPQWWSMGRQLYESEPLFNKWINLIDGEMTKINKGEWRLLEELIEKKNEQESRINDTNIAQPPLFAIQVALAALLVSWNIYPSFIISHSGGDQAAAFVAGCLSLKGTVRIEHLVCIAVVNSPRSVTISARLRIENAFHSYPMNRFDIEKKMLSSLKDIRRLPVQDQKQNFVQSNVRQVVRFYDAIAAIIKDEAANVFIEISPHPVLAKSIRECYELANQQQSSPLILPTLKRKENEQITLLTSLAQLTTSSHVWQQYFHTRQISPLKNHEEYFDNFPLYKFHLSPCWYESKDSAIQRLANRIPTHPLLGIRQLNDQTSATWKSLININLPQHAFLKDHKIQDAILFPAVAYLELATAACQQLLSSKEDD